MKREIYDTTIVVVAYRPFNGDPTEKSYVLPVFLRDQKLNWFVDRLCDFLYTLGSDVTVKEMRSGYTLFAPERMEVDGITWTSDFDIESLRTRAREANRIIDEPLMSCSYDAKHLLENFIDELDLEGLPNNWKTSECTHHMAIPKEFRPLILAWERLAIFLRPTNPELSIASLTSCCSQQPCEHTRYLSAEAELHKKFEICTLNE